VKKNQSLSEASRQEAVKRKLYVLSHQKVSLKVLAIMFVF
jgi:hypothetical protein